MTIIALDLGISQTGVAISEGEIARPMTTLKSKNLKQLLDKLSEILTDENPQKVVVGKLSGTTANFYDQFKKSFTNSFPDLEMVEVDETLTTRQARDTMIKLQVPKKRKKGKEHQIAACLILQNYLEGNA